MSQPPWGPPGPLPPAPPTRPVRGRPSAWWFVPAALLLVVAPALFVGGLVWTVRPLLSPDAYLPTDGRVYSVTLPAHTRRGLFVRRGSVTPQCRLADRRGREVEPRSETGTLAGAFAGSDLRVFEQFDTGDGTVTVFCLTTGPRERVYIGPVASTADLARAVLLGVVAPGLLGLGGLAVLVVVALLRSRRPVYGPTDPPWLAS